MECHGKQRKEDIVHSHKHAARILEQRTEDQGKAARKGTTRIDSILSSIKATTPLRSEQNYRFTVRSGVRLEDYSLIQANRAFLYIKRCCPSSHINTSSQSEYLVGRPIEQLASQIIKRWLLEKADAPKKFETKEEPNISDHSSVSNEASSASSAHRCDQTNKKISLKVESFIDTEKDILMMATSSAYSSLILQRYIKKQEIIPPKILEVVQKHLELLLFHKFGCYVVRDLLVRDCEVRKAIVDMAEEHLVELLSDDYSCRVLQRLSKVDAVFRKKTFRRIINLWPTLVNQQSATFFLTISLQLTANTSEEFQLLKKELFKDKNMIMRSRFNKRILVSFVRFCTPEDLEFVYKTLQLSSKILNCLKDRYFVYILHNMLVRNFEPLVQSAFRLMTTNMPLLFRQAHFRFFLMLIFKKTSEVSPEVRKKFRNAILIYLTELEESNSLNVCSSLDDWYLLNLLAESTSTELSSNRMLEDRLFKVAIGSLSSQQSPASETGTKEEI